MRICRDSDCVNAGIAQNDSEFGRSEYRRKFGLKDGIDTICKACRRRKTREYRETLTVLQRRTKVKLPESFYR